MSPSPAWLEWGTAAFSRAASLDRPVLLLVTTWWAEAGRTLERTTLADGEVVALADDRFVPVRVDADRRPDIGERYTLGGWPTLLALTPLGQPLGGGTLVETARLLVALRALADTYSASRDGLLCQTVPPPWAREAALVPAVGPDLEAATWFVERLLDWHDPDHGGFGAGGKRLHAPALRLALRRLATEPDPALTRVVTSTLDAIGTCLVVDEGRGGAFRSTQARDWSGPDRARLLEVQADAVGLFADAWTVLGDPRWRALALGLVDFVRRRLGSRGDGAFSFAALGSEVDPVVQLDANCRMAGALMRAAAALDEPRLAEDGVGVVERVVPAAYEKNAGLAHSLDPYPQGWGLLGDQVAAAAALLEAAAVSGRQAYADLAEELMRSALRRLWSGPRGALLDRVHTPAEAGDIGWLRLPLEPLACNCEAAGVLAELARLTGDAGLHARALDILTRFAGEWRSAGLDGACYPLAVMDVVRQ